jgi:hypothetical protein
MVTMHVKQFVAIGAIVLTAGCGGGTAAVTHSTTPSPSFSSPGSSSARTLTASSVAQQMGLNRITGYVAYTAATDENHLLGRPGQYTSKVNWGNYGDSSAALSYPVGGSIETFANTTDMHARLSYLQAFKPPVGDGYDYTSGTSILRLSTDYTPAQAQALRKAFDSAAG